MKNPLKGVPKQNDSYIDRYLYRPISIHISGVLMQLGMTPNQATSLSLLFAIAAAACYAVGAYKYLVIGAILLTISHLFDTADGEIARAKNMKSDFGAWFDSVADRLSIFVLFFGASYGVYRATGSELTFAVGFLAAGTLTIVGMISSMKKYLPFMQGHHEGQSKSGSYIGIGSMTLFVMTLAALLNIVMFLVWFYALLGTVMLLKQIHSHYVRGVMMHGSKKTK